MPEIPLRRDLEEWEQTLDETYTLMGIWQFPNDLSSVLDFKALSWEGVNRTRAAGTDYRFSDLFRGALVQGMKDADAKGRVAGAVFLKTLQLKLHRPERASIGIGTYVVSRLLEQTRDEKGRKVSADRDNIHKKWSNVRPAAHLWAATQHLLERGHHIQVEHLSIPVAPMPHAIFCTAQALLSLARKLDWHFDPDPWELPSHYQTQPANIQLEAPDQHTMELVENYRAPVRPK